MRTSFIEASHDVAQHDACFEGDRQIFILKLDSQDFLNPSLDGMLLPLPLEELLIGYLFPIEAGRHMGR